MSDMTTASRGRKPSEAAGAPFPLALLQYAFTLPVRFQGLKPAAGLALALVVLGGWHSFALAVDAEPAKPSAATHETAAPTPQPISLETWIKRQMPRVFSYPVATFILAVGLWLAMPRGRHGGRAVGVVLALVGLGMLAARLPVLGPWKYETVIWLLGGITIVSGIGTISMRSPVYCALWFAMALLGTGALFMFVGAQFLGVATVVVYAGAIVVTFLFVLMLAQPEGQDFYDRVSWEPLLSALTGAVMILLLSLALESSLGGAAAADLAAKSPTPQTLEKGVLTPQHVAAVGGVLFSRYLIAVEVAGVLLLVALVGASAIIAYQRTPARHATGTGEEGRP